jgi:undecaprenyl-diphosphatase
MARMLGLERREAAKFSMLLAIPVIVIAGAVTLFEIYRGGNLSEIREALSGIGYSFVFSILSIYVLMIWLKRWSFLPFVLYRIALGTILLLDAYGIYEIKF